MGRQVQDSKVARNKQMGKDPCVTPAELRAFLDEMGSFTEAVRRSRLAVISDFFVASRKGPEAVDKVLGTEQEASRFIEVVLANFIGVDEALRVIIKELKFCAQSTAEFLLKELSEFPDRFRGRIAELVSKTRELAKAPAEAVDKAVEDFKKASSDLFQFLTVFSNLVKNDVQPHVG